jgi:hypothetical protein
MEPLTILSAAAATSAVAGKSYELVNWIRELCQGVKTVDERVQRLKSGVSELASACESVHAALQPDSSSTPLTPPWDKDGSLATSISHQASNCRRTLKELKGILSDLRPGKSNRISRHMKLQDRGKQIDGLSARISTHTNALQMSLQIATIKIALATPDFVIRELKEALRDIRKLLGGTEDRNFRSLRPSSVKGDDEDQLLGLAQDALRCGTTLYEASVAGSTVGADSVMGSEKAVSVGKWIHETGGAAQDIHAAQNNRFHLASGASNLRTPTTNYPAGYGVPEVSSPPEFFNDDGSSSWEDEEKPAPTAEPSCLRRPPSDFSRPLDWWDRSQVLSLFGIEPDGRIEVMICAGTKLDTKELSCLKRSRERNRNKLALHLAVLVQDLRLVESLVGLGYSPNLSVQPSDIKPLTGLRTPIEIAIASHSEPITKVLLEHGAELDPKSSSSPCLQLFATPALDQWHSTDLDTYMRVLRLLLAFGFTWINPENGTTWTQLILHQICDLPKAWFHLRRPLLIFTLGFYGRKWRDPSFSPLHILIEIQDLKTLKFLLRTSDPQSFGIHLQMSPLHYAIEASLIRNDEVSVDVVRALLERGASLDETAREPSQFLWIKHKRISRGSIAMQSFRADMRKLVAEYSKK